jgi:hypothetical protein
VISILLPLQAVEHSTDCKLKRWHIHTIGRRNRDTCEQGEEPMEDDVGGQHASVSTRN